MTSSDNADHTRNPLDSQEPAPLGSRWLVVALALAVFLAVAPTLVWQEFSGGSENLVVGSVLEVKRSGQWLIPTLHGRPRVNKPPLPTWITAAAVSDQTVRQLSDPDPARRDQAYRALAWQVRWPALLATCLLLVAVYELGRTLAGPPVGLASAAIAATCALVLRFGRYATTDVYLALFVALANVFFARALLQSCRWSGWLIGGASLGLAIMCKGPVAILQTLVPLAVFLGIMRFIRPAPTSTRPRRILPVLCGILVMLAVATPWFIMLLVRDPNLIAHWKKEVTRRGATGLKPDPWYLYIILLPNLLPWLGFIIVGTIKTFAQRHWRLLPALCLVIVPVLVMSFIPDKKDRYLLPFAVPAAILGGFGVVASFKTKRGDDPWIDVAIIIHWATLGLVVVGLPIMAAGKSAAKSIGADPWCTPPLAVALGLLGALLLVAGIMRRSAGRLVVSSTIILLLANAGFMWGYAHGKSGRAELKGIGLQIQTHWPDAQVYYFNPPDNPKPQPIDMHIYTNRVVQETTDPASIPPSNKTQVLVILQREKAPAPTAQGWTPACWAPSGQRRWHALTRSPAPTTQATR